jgi:hypothetical protein
MIIGEKSVDINGTNKSLKLSFYDDNKDRILNPSELRRISSLISYDDDHITIERPGYNQRGFYVSYGVGAEQSDLERINPQREYKLQIRPFPKSELVGWKGFVTPKVGPQGNTSPIGESSLIGDDINGEQTLQQSQGAKGLNHQTHGYCAFQVVDGAYPVEIENKLVSDDGYDYASDGYHFGVANCFGAQGLYEETYDADVDGMFEAHKHVYICKVRLGAPGSTQGVIATLKKDDEIIQQVPCAMLEQSQRPPEQNYVTLPREAPSLGRLPRVHLGESLFI